MEIRQLKYFMSIAETGSFSEASRLQFVTQSAISQQIKALEDELGAQLFMRLPHGAMLTENGKALMPYAKRILKDMSNCFGHIADLKGMLCGELNIGLTFTLEPYVREAMLAFMKAYPKVQLNAYYKNLPELLRKLHNNEIDIMLSMMPTSPHEFVDSVPLLEYRLAAVMRKSHPLADKKMLTFEDLRTQRLILPEKGLRDRNAIESYIHTETGDLNVCSLVNDANAILNLLQDSNFVSILAENTIANRPSLCCIPIDKLTQPIQVFAHFNNNICHKHSADVFIKMFCETPAYFVSKHLNG